MRASPRAVAVAPPVERCPRCLRGVLVRVHAHDECPLCRYVEPCCGGEHCAR